MRFIDWFTNWIKPRSCEGCMARASEITRLAEENRNLRAYIHEVIDQQKDMLRDLLRLNQPTKQAVTRETNPAPIRKVTSIQSRIHEAEQRDREEYNKRLAQELESPESAS